MFFGICFSTVLIRKVLLAAVAATTLAQLEANAQMQIPNPLIRPRGLTHAAESDGAQTQYNPRQANQPASVSEDPYTHNLNELKERYANFFVSAIVGKKAMLRRSAAARSPPTSANTQAVGTSMAPVPLGTNLPAASQRSDALMLIDGELIASVGTTGALVAKVTSSDVIIYHVQETMTAPGGKLVGNRTVIFSGSLENSSGGGTPAIVLERPDPAYKRMITVENRVRSTSSSQSDSSATNTSNTNSTSGTTSPPPGIVQ